MKISEFFAALFGKKATGGGETVIIDIPPELYYKELAVYTASSLIANAVSLCEFRCFENGRPVRNADYYRLNVAPNKNENSSLFWHRVVQKMIRDPMGALVVEINGELHCAEHYSVRLERPVLGNLYDGVILDGGFQMNRVFTSQEVYLFRMEDECVSLLINGINEQYGRLLESAARAFRDTNGRKFKFKVDSMMVGDDDYAEEFKNVISKRIKAYMENEYATYVEYEGEELEEQTGKQSKGIDDFVKIREDMFQLVAGAFKIPQSLMAGNITSLKEVCDVFLTFAVDPIADAMTAVLNKRATYSEYASGNYYMCYSGKVKHKDLFDLASDADKLFASSLMCADELREELGLSPIGEPWSRQHYVTNNYSRVEDAAQPVKEGEEE